MIDFKYTKYYLSNRNKQLIFGKMKKCNSVIEKLIEEDDIDSLLCYGIYAGRIESQVENFQKAHRFSVYLKHSRKRFSCKRRVKCHIMSITRMIKRFREEKNENEK